MNKLLYYILFIFIIIIIFLFINKFLFKIQENYCYIPKYNSAGVPNSFDIDFNYKAQSNIKTGNCDKYWKDYAVSSNSYDLFDSYTIPVNPDQLKLPVTSNFGNQNYAVDLIDYNKLAKISSDKYKNYLENSKILNINPITKKKENNYENVKFKILMLNKETMKNYRKNINIQNNKGLDYNFIKSPIEDINILNKLFLKKMNDNQLKVMNKFSKLYFGLRKYYIINYKIINILYYNSNKNIPVYLMSVSLFRNGSYFITSYAYIGLKLNNKFIVTKIEYIGVLVSSIYFDYKGSQLISNNNNPANDELKYSYNYLDPTFVLNKNFNNFKNRITNSDEVINIQNEHRNNLKLENQYACFNINPNADTTFLPYMNKNMCESPLDAFGKLKPVGIFDKPCKKNEECPFYKANKNYDNNFGKCINGKCELPVNMDHIGYHYYQTNQNSNPLCYNCNSKKFNLLNNEPNDCCIDQFDKKKYPFLKSPDYAFKNDNLKRKNIYVRKNFNIGVDGNFIKKTN